MRASPMRNLGDVVDRANNLTQHEIDSLVANRKIYHGHSSSYCCECGEPIPEARRDAVPGVSLCIDCQRINEMRRRHGL